MSENSAAATPLSPAALADIERRALSVHDSALVKPIAQEMLALVGEVRRLRAQIEEMKETNDG